MHLLALKSPRQGGDDFLKVKIEEIARGRIVKDGK
jgi:hypothetical protein